MCALGLVLVGRHLFFFLKTNIHMSKFHHLALQNALKEGLVYILALAIC